MKGLVVALALALGGCSLPVRYVTVPLPEPLPPILPAVQEHELQCLSDSAYERLVVREKRLRAYVDELRAVIETHNQGVEPE
jgi:hypothetical protein